MIEDNDRTDEEAQSNDQKSGFPFTRRGMLAVGAAGLGLAAGSGTATANSGTGSGGDGGRPLQQRSPKVVVWIDSDGIIHAEAIDDETDRAIPDSRDAYRVFQAIADEMGAGTITVHAGEYTFSQTATFNEGQYIVGDGMDRTFLDGTAGSGPIEFVGPQGGGWGCGVEKCSFRVVNGTGKETELRIKDIWFATIRDCKFTYDPETVGLQGTSILIEGIAYHPYIENCRFLAQQIACVHTKANGAVLVNNDFAPNSGRLQGGEGSVGVLNEAGATTIVNNYFEVGPTFGAGAHIRQKGRNNAFSTIANNAIGTTREFGNQVEIQEGSSIIESNFIIGGPESGIVITSDHDTSHQVSGNFIQEFGDSAVIVDGGSNVDISRNIVTTSQGDADTFIKSTNGTRYNAMGNTFRRDVDSEMYAVDGNVEEFRSNEVKGLGGIRGNASIAIGNSVSTSADVNGIRAFRAVGNSVRDVGKFGVVALHHCVGNSTLDCSTGILTISDDILIGHNTIKGSEAGIQVRSADSGIRLLGNSIFDTATPIKNNGVIEVARDNKGFITENDGTVTASGDGTTTVFTILHGLDVTPSVTNVWAETADATGEFFVSNATSTNIEITYSSAPPSGSDNLAWGFEAKKLNLIGSDEESSDDEGSSGDEDDTPETVYYNIASKTITPDGDLETDGLSTWNVASDGTLIELANGENAGTLGGDVWLSWDADNLYFQAAVDDQTHIQPYEPGELFKADNIQVAVAPGSGGWDEFLQYTLALNNDGAQVYGQTKPSNESQSVRDFDVAIIRDDAEKVTRYEVAIPWVELDSIGGFDPSNDEWIGVDWAIMDDDTGDGLDNYARWDVTGDSAITGGKQPDQLKTAQLFD